MMRRTIFTLLLCLSLQPLLAQENSPYSRYGIGLLKEQENISNRGMGGTSIADNSPSLVNPLNPASYAGLKLTTYQLGMEGAMFTIRSANQSNRTGGSGLSYMNVGVPLISGKAGLSFGLLPYSRVNYSMQQNDDITDISQVQYDYFGGGSIQKAYIGTAYKYQGLSLGFNFGYLFGNYQNNVSEAFVDTLNILTTDILNRTILNGTTWEIGAMYELALKDEHFFNVGATYSLGANLNAKRDKFWFGSLGGADLDLYTYAADSVIAQEGKVNLPSTISLGVMYGKGNVLTNGMFWKVGADFIRSDWSNYSSYNQADSFKQSYTIRAGAQIIPDVGSVRSFWKKATYRFGGYYRLEPLSLNNVQLTTAAVTAGLGLPIGNVRSGIGQANLSYQLGQRGTLENGLVRESFSRFGVGVTLNARWFIKRRYN